MRASKKQEVQIVVPPQYSYLRPKYNVNKIRLGNDHDGGYVVAECLLSETQILISLGISDDWSFDNCFKEKNPGIEIHAYDFSISIFFFFRKIVKNVLKTFLCGRKMQIGQDLRKCLSFFLFFRGTNLFFRKKVVDQPSRKNEISFDQIMNKVIHSRIFLKMDIEGSEYLIIDQVCNYSEVIQGMVIEFHDTDLRRIEFENAIQALLENYEIIHIHPNNFRGIGRNNIPEVLEVTFIHKNIVVSVNEESNVQSSLDNPNNPNREEIILTFQV